MKGKRKAAARLRTAAMAPMAVVPPAAATQPRAAGRPTPGGSGAPASAGIGAFSCARASPVRYTFTSYRLRPAREATRGPPAPADVTVC